MAEKLGTAMIKSVGPGSLRAGAGKEARRTNEDVFCGTISGVAYGVVSKANTKDPTRMSHAFQGSFVAVTSDGTVIRPIECYLPSMVENSLIAVLEKSQTVNFVFDIWAVPDERDVNTIGFMYVVRDRRPQQQNDPALDLAYEAGILPRPQAAIQHSPGSEPAHDAETGEIKQPVAEKSLEPVKSGNHKK